MRYLVKRVLGYIADILDIRQVLIYVMADTYYNEFK